MVAKIIPEERICPGCNEPFLVGGGGRPRRNQTCCSSACAYRVGHARSGKQPSLLTHTQQAYLAGMIDADGHVGIYGHTGPRSGGSRVRLSIANTHLGMLEWVRESTGIGSITSGPPPGPEYKQKYEWVTSAGSATALLEQLIPYMIVKKDRAELAVEYQKGLGDPQNRADINWREGYREKMLALNKRGPVAA